MSKSEGSENVVDYQVSQGVAFVTMNRPKYRNAQNSQMTYELDNAFRRAVDDIDVKVIVLAGEGPHFSAGHDIGTPGRDIDKSFERKLLWYDHVGLPGAEMQYVREQEVYLGMCRRWADMPKPIIAKVQGACVAGGMMLAWVCDLIVATEDAFFADPVVHMGIPGIEYFAHAFELPSRVAKKMLYTGYRLSAEEAKGFGMVSDVVPRENLDEATIKLAEKIAKMPRLGLALTKQALNHCEDLKGKRNAMEAVFGMHHFAHAHSQLISGNNLGGLDGKDMARMGQNKGEA